MITPLLPKAVHSCVPCGRRNPFFSLLPRETQKSLLDVFYWVICTLPRFTGGLRQVSAKIEELITQSCPTLSDPIE